MQLAAFTPTPLAGWWGASTFKSAGTLEGLSEPDAAAMKQRKTFTEDTQTNLYMAVHGAQTQGKKGLGKSSTIKIAGELA